MISHANVSMKLTGGGGKSSIFIFLDSDVLIYPETIQVIKNYFSENINVGALTGKIGSQPPKGNFFSVYKNIYMNHTFSLMGKNVRFLYGSLCAIRRSCFKYWPEEESSKQRPGVEDSALGMRLINEGVQIHCPEGLEMIHLKEYTFFSLVKNDFRVAYDFAHLFLKNAQWKTLFSKKSNFSHISKRWMYSILTLGALLISLPVYLVASLFFFLLWLLLNLPFHVHLMKVRGVTFALIAGIWNFFNQLVIMMGIGLGSGRFLGKLAFGSLAPRR